MVRSGEPMSALPLSGSASSRSLIGITITPTTIRITITVTAGTLVTMATQRPPMVFCPVVAALASLVVRDVGLGRRCSPKMPRSAGSRVRAAATATATPLRGREAHHAEERDLGHRQAAQAR